MLVEKINHNNLMKTFIIASILLFSFPTFAFLHFEPGIGYNRGSLQSSKAQGIGLTTKLGVEFTNFFIVADAGFHDLQLGSTTSSTASDVGLAIGGDFREWRFWFTYIASASIKTETASATNDYKGDGMKLGMSGRLSRNAYMNLEFRFIDINELNSSVVSQLLDVGLLSVSWKLL